MNSAALLRLAKRRSQQLRIDAAEVLDAEILGAYHYAPLSLVEYCMHEAAHLITLGFLPEKFNAFVKNFCPPHLGLQYALGRIFDNMSKEAGDALEIDASIVAFLAGVRLGLWSDSDAIQDSCLKNLSDGTTLAGRARVREAFTRVIGEEPCVTGYGSTQYHRHADALARWFKGKSTVLTLSVRNP